MSGQPCKGFLGFSAMKRALRRPLSRDADGRCGYFPRGLPLEFRTLPGGAQSSRHGVKSRTYPQKFMSGRACFLRRNPGVSLRSFARAMRWQPPEYGWRILSGPLRRGDPTPEKRRPRIVNQENLRGRGRSLGSLLSTPVPSRRYFLSFSRKCLRNLATFGATTNWQYGWRGLRAKYSW